MTELSTGALLLFILGLLTVSAYFAGSETAMMALNRYRMRHMANAGHAGAVKANRLLQRPDRLLGVILVGNNIVNFLAASFAAEVANRMVGEATGPLVSAVVLTIVVLIFAEVTPKTVAAARPESIAFPSSYLLQPLLKVASPLVTFINWISNALATPFLSGNNQRSEQLSVEELKTVLDEHTALPREQQDMLLGILDLENVNVEHIMVPRSELVGIDIDEPPADILDAVRNAPYTRLPVFRRNIDDVVGILHLRRAAGFAGQDAITRAQVLEKTEEPYYVPVGTRLHTQLYNFRKERQVVALVVDEYGDIEGMVTLQDILEEIVGEFTTDFADEGTQSEQQDDGSYLIEGRAMLRDVNRSLGWDLPTAGPRTVNGLIVEHLESIPDANVSMRIGTYQIETLQIVDNVVRAVRVTVLPAPPSTSTDEDQ